MQRFPLPALLAVLNLFLAACEKPPAEVDFNDPNVEMTNEGKTARYKTSPYTGLIRRKHSNQKVAGEYPYVNGSMHGIMKEWWDNSQPSAETHFKNGQRHGLNRYWDMKGRLTKEQTYDHDQSISEKYF
jgi:hypothetical protein